MWTANAATVTGHDITVANLSSSLHRSIEAETTIDELRELLPKTFRIHPPLSGGHAMRDEGAANHMRLSAGDGHASVHVFVHGDHDPRPMRHLARQSKASFDAIARRHALKPDQFFQVKQSAVAIDAGAFHNDVVAISHGRTLIHHEYAFHQSDRVMESLEEQFVEVTGQRLVRIVVAETDLPLDDAVATYLFNSQVVAAADDPRNTMLVCPVEVSLHPVAKAIVDGWIANGHFRRVQFIDLGESMAGGGGPACLRLRIPMPADEVAGVSAVHRWTQTLDEKCEAVIDAFYPTAVTLKDLTDATFNEQVTEAQQRIEAIFRD